MVSEHVNFVRYTHKVGNNEQRFELLECRGNKVFFNTKSAVLLSHSYSIHITQSRQVSRQFRYCPLLQVQEFGCLNWLELYLKAS